MTPEQFHLFEDVSKAVGYWEAVSDFLRLLEVGEDGRPLQILDLSRAISDLAEAKHSMEKLDERAKTIALGSRR